MAPEPQSWSARDQNSELDFWNLFDDEDQGKTTTLAHLATIHYQHHRRPLRIALDQDSWNYGITRQKEREIQKSQRAAFNKRKRKEQQRIWCKKYNPSEKLRLFHREVNVLVRLMSYIGLGIEFYVIIPSPLPLDETEDLGDRYKHANGKMHIWFRILGDLGIRFHAATNPAVECAHMQAAGVVDVIWTNNPDIMVYSGPQAVIFRDHLQTEEETNFQNVRVYRMKQLRQKLSWGETVFIHTLFRSGYSPFDISKMEHTGDFVKCIARKPALNLCKCRNQDEVDKWLQYDMASYYNLNGPSKVKYPILEECLVYSAASDDLYSNDAQLFRQRKDVRMQEINATREDNLRFYNTNVVDRTRRLWEYARDTFFMNGAQFLSLTSGVLLVRSFIAGSTNYSGARETSLDSRTVQMPFKVEDWPALWNLRIKMTENLTGMILNPTILKALVVDDQSGYSGAGGSTRSIKDTSSSKTNLRPRKKTRRRR